MLIKTKNIDCESKNIFKTLRLPTGPSDLSGDIYWSAVVFIRDTGEMWTHGRLYGGFFSNVDSNKVSLSIGGIEKQLSLDGHTQPYTSLTGSGTIADQVILSTGVANKWTLKTLGKNAFSNDDYLLADATAVAAEKVVNALKFKYNSKDIYSFDGSAARTFNLIQGDNVIISGDAQGNITIAADPGNDTVNTAGATNLINKKLFLIGAESQTTAPQTYSNQYVYIGTDNCLYSLGKKVLTEHQAIYGLNIQTLVGSTPTKVVSYNPNTANETFTIAQGTNITLTPDASNKKITISSKDTTYNFYNLAFKHGDVVVDTYKPTTSPNKVFKSGTNVTLSKSGDDIVISTQDTKNTVGSTEKLTTKLFLVGTTAQTSASQSFSNSKVFIGSDNRLYSDGKVVSTGDHTHNYAGATSPGGPALKVDLNPSGLADATYGTYGGLLQDSNKGPVSGSWSNRIKILHNNTQGFYTELAQNFTGTAGLWHRRCNAGSVSSWTPVIDNANFHTYLDGTYIQKGTDPNQLTNYVRYSLASGLTIYWAPADVTPTQVLGFKSNDSSKAYTFSGANIRAFANAVNKSGDTMTGTLTVSTKGTGAYNQGIRINRTAADQWATLTIGNVGTGTSGTSDSTWLIGTPGNSNSLIFNRNSANESSGLCLKGHGNTDMKWNNNTVWHAGNDGSGSGLDADLLDGVHLMQKGSTAGVMRSWARGTHTTVNQYFGNGVVVVIDPKPTDSNDLWVNTTIFSVGDTSIRNWQMAFGYGADVIKVRKNNDGWGSWKTLAFLDSKVASSTNSDYPTGFSSRSTSSTWGNTTGTHITGWHTSTGGDIAFMDDNPSAGKVSIKINGLFYQDEGKYKVLDTNNYSATLDGRYLRIGETVTSGTNSKYLSFANNAGGVGGTMGDNDQWRIYARSTASNAGYLEIATADDGNEPIYFRQYTGVFSTLKRTLTLLDGSGNTSMPGSLSVTGTTTSGNFNTGGRYISNFSSGTWINSVTNAVLTCNYSGYGGIINAPTKGGRITIATYPDNDNIVYLVYATSAQISAGTNAYNRQARWNADNGFLYATGHVKDGSSDSYVLLGGGGHATLSGLGGSHTHTIFRNNLMIKGTNGISDSASIHLALGDSDTGFKWISDGVCQMYADDVAIGQWNSGGMNWLKQPSVNGQKIWHAGNDGSGSGLDADLLDGKHLSDLVPLKSQYTWSSSDTRPYNYMYLCRIANTSGYSTLRLNLSLKSRYSQSDLYIAIECGQATTSTTVNIRKCNTNISPANLYYKTTTEGSYVYVDLYVDCGAWNTVGYVLTNVGVNGSLSHTPKGTLTDSLPSGYATIGDIEYKVNVNSATKLQTARQINGTNFDGTANITTAKWGTARSIKIGNTAKNVDGSGNVTWTFAEIGGAAANHTHGLLHDNFTTTIANTTTDSGWGMINSSYNGFILKSLRMQGSAPSWVLGNCAAGICFGGSDTKGVLSVSYNIPSIKFAGGNGSKPVWYFGITGNNGATYNLSTFATSSQLSNYLPISGGTISGTLTANSLKKSGSSNSYALLGGGGHKLLSDFTLDVDWTLYKSSKGYMKFPNGFIIQWGESYIGSNSTQNITFPYTFPSTCISVQVTHKSTATNWDKVCMAGNYSRTYFVLANCETVNSTVNWVAFGY